MTSQRFTTVLISLALLLGLLSALDAVSPQTDVASALRTAEPARSGAWTCPAPGLERLGAITMVATAAPGGLESAPVPTTDVSAEPAPAETVAPAGGTGVAAEVTYDRFSEGSEARVVRNSPFPEQALADAIEHPQFPIARNEFGLTARWRRQPAVIGRVWERSAEFGPSGLLVAPCIPGTSSMWVVPGLSTAGGAEATLVMANPYASDASVTVTLATPVGREQPALLENVVVPAKSLRLLSLNQHAPERRDVGAIVTTRSGRVVVEAMQSLNAAIGGIEAVTMVRAASAGASSWTIPWVPTTPAAPDPDDPDAAGLDGLSDDSGARSDDGDGDEPLLPTITGETRLTLDEGIDGTPSSWIWVANVGDDDAPLLVTVHGPRGGELLDFGGDDLLAPGAMRRIELDGILTFARTAVTVASENGTPIVVSIASQVTSDDEDRTGLSVQLGAPAPDPVWSLPGETSADRTHVLALVNPGGEEALVAISTWTTEGILRPEKAQRIEVPAGTLRLVELDDVLDPRLGTSAVHVQAVAGEVVAGRVSFSPGDRLSLVVNVGVPSVVWRGGTLVPVTRFDPALTGEVPRPVDDAESAP